MISSHYGRRILNNHSRTCTPTWLQRANTRASGTLGRRASLFPHTKPSKHIRQIVRKQHSEQESKNLNTHPATTWQLTFFEHEGRSIIPQNISPKNVEQILRWQHSRNCVRARHRQDCSFATIHDTHAVQEGAIRASSHRSEHQNVSH
jgi:hypothetical protein